MKKPERAPQRAATITARAAAAQMFRPKSCHATPTTMEVRPTMEETWMSMPPVIMTMLIPQESTMREALLFRMLRKFWGLAKLPPRKMTAYRYRIKNTTTVLVSRRAGRRNFWLAEPKMTNSITRSSTKKAFQLKLGPLRRRLNQVFIWRTPPHLLLPSGRPGGRAGSARRCAAA